MGNARQTMQTQQKPNRRNRAAWRGFSLLELMASMAIIAILSAAAMPGIQSAILAARQTQAAQHARSIGIAMNAWAQDYEGIFPNRELLANEDEEASVESSNDVFRHLVPDFIDNEKVFAVSVSSWGRFADGRISDGQALEPGENHFAYISGLLTTSRSHWPLIVDGTDGDGYYHATPGEKGGAWHGRKAIVVRVDGSVAQQRLIREGERRFIPRLEEPGQNALDVGAYMPGNAELLEPEEE